MVQTRAQRIAAAADAAGELASAAAAVEAAAAPVAGRAAPAADATATDSVMRTNPLFGALSPERDAPHAAEDAAEAEVSASALGGEDSPLENIAQAVACTQADVDALTTKMSTLSAQFLQNCEQLAPIMSTPSKVAWLEQTVSDLHAENKYTNELQQKAQTQLDHVKHMVEQNCDSQERLEGALDHITTSLAAVTSAVRDVAERIVSIAGVKAPTGPASAARWSRAERMAARDLRLQPRNITPRTPVMVPLVHVAPAA